MASVRLQRDVERGAGRGAIGFVSPFAGTVCGVSWLAPRVWGTTGGSAPCPLSWQAGCVILKLLWGRDFQTLASGADVRWAWFQDRCGGRFVPPTGGVPPAAAAAAPRVARWVFSGRNKKPPSAFGPTAVCCAQVELVCSIALKPDYFFLAVFFLAVFFLAVFFFATFFLAVFFLAAFFFGAAFFATFFLVAAFFLATFSPPLKRKPGIEANWTTTATC